MTTEEKKNLLDKCQQVADDLKTAGILVSVDTRDNYSPGWKFNHWELKVLHEFLFIVVGSVIVSRLKVTPLCFGKVSVGRPCE